MSRHRIALVGLGMAVRPHAESLADLDDRVEVAWAFSPSAERRASFAADWTMPIADSLEQILADDTVEAVMLLTPPNTHLELATACARAGKHVLLEKPVEVTTERAEALVRECRKAGVRLGLVLQHRFRPSGLRLAELLADDRLGRLVGVDVSVANWRPQSYYDQPGRGTLARDGGGVLITQAIHTLDLAIALLGLPTEVSAFAATSPVHEMETEDIVAAALRFPNGAIGTLCATTTAYPGYPERIFVIGEKGTASLVGTTLEVRYHDGTEFNEGEAGAGGGTGADPMAFPNDYHRSVLADFLNAIEAGRDPKISGEEALRVHYLIDALLKSSELGRPAKVRQK
ncbi:Gfo/Idh/MocA family oxidoreductase [Microbaculum marinum]|uniref:Gfo/Idh/MocA family oxidoreductase n=1 Tax=Microbaculum marinum TaxID=1764581 RepID=A0AAW9RUS5_9HYPH